MYIYPLRSLEEPFDLATQDKLDIADARLGWLDFLLVMRVPTLDDPRYEEIAARVAEATEQVVVIVDAATEFLGLDLTAVADTGDAQLNIALNTLQHLTGTEFEPRTRNIAQNAINTLEALRLSDIFEDQADEPA